jgi:hypothetical protein|tara:strand:+ start:723 stop:977 length:255 start_codon:yes stop_codon:yes gene_type:complete
MAMTNTVTDADILFDLEYRGIQDFLGEMDSGLKVPTPFVNRVIDIVKNAYDITLCAKAATTKQYTGSFCLLPYTDATMSVLIKE